MQVFVAFNPQTRLPAVDGNGNIIVFQSAQEAETFLRDFDLNTPGLGRWRVKSVDSDDLTNLTTNP
jgi:hypothetical protein